MEDHLQMSPLIKTGAGKFLTGSHGRLYVSNLTQHVGHSPSSHVNGSQTTKRRQQSVIIKVCAACAPHHRIFAA